MGIYTILLIIILIIAIALILIVMVQNPKGGGLSSSFGGSSGMSIGGVQNTNTFLDKATWGLAIAMFALILLANFTIPRDKASAAPELNNTLDNIEVTTPVENTENVAKDSVN